MLGRLGRAIEWIAAPEGAPIDVWRRRILAAVLLGVCLLGLFAYIVGVGAAVATGQYPVVIVDTIGYIVVIGITVARRLPYTLRAGVITVLPGVLGTYFLYGFGFFAAGFPWLMTFPIFASVLLGMRAGVWAFAGVVFVLVGLGVLIPTGLMPWTALAPNVTTMWWVSTSSVLTLTGLVSLSTGYLFEGLGREAAARQAAVLEADRRERLAALGTLTGGIAHDFNNLLQPIVSDAEHARRLIDHQHAATPLLDDILLSAHRARTLVRRILSFARPTAHGDLETVDLGALVQESERLLRAIVPANVNLVTSIHDDVQVMADAAELQQILLNLVSNAAHAMPRGGTATITVNHTAGGGAFAGTVLGDVPRVAILTVADSGTGMDSETLARAFEPFFTTKRPGHGTGLGLATVHATVTALGGIVRAESKVSAGTRITVYLPVAVADAAAPVTVTRLAADNEQVTPAHIVIVDDEPAVLLATSRLIERLGYSVSRFERPGDLLARLDELTPAPRLVLTDLSMPELNGWELAKQLGALRPELPVVVMTGNLDHDSHDDHTNSSRSVAGVLSKPFTSAELRATLQRCLV